MTILLKDLFILPNGCRMIVCKGLYNILSNSVQFIWTMIVHIFSYQSCLRYPTTTSLSSLCETWELCSLRWVERQDASEFQSTHGKLVSVYLTILKVKNISLNYLENAVRRCQGSVWQGLSVTCRSWMLSWDQSLCDPLKMPGLIKGPPITIKINYWGPLAAGVDFSLWNIFRLGYPKTRSITCLINR